MTEEVVAALAIIIFAWSITSGVLPHHNVTGPLLFAVAGAALLPIAFEYADIRIVLYAVLSLTVIRMAPISSACGARASIGPPRHSSPGSDHAVSP